MFLDEKLINTVQQYPILYDVSDKNYYNIAMKEAIWEEIAKQFDESGVDLKKRWNQLRDAFRKALKKKRKKCVQAAKRLKPWKYEEQMSFLKDHLNDDRNQIVGSPKEDCTVPSEKLKEESDIFESQSLLDNDDSKQTITETTVCTPSRTASSNVMKRKKPQENYIKLLESYLQKREKLKTVPSDHLSSYFKAAEDTVRTFSPLLQVEVKSKISELLSEYELKNILSTMPEPAPDTQTNNMASSPPPVSQPVSGKWYMQP